MVAAICGDDRYHNPLDAFDWGQARRDSCDILIRHPSPTIDPRFLESPPIYQHTNPPCQWPLVKCSIAEHYPFLAATPSVHIYCFGSTDIKAAQLAAD